MLDKADIVRMQGIDRRLLAIADELENQPQPLKNANLIHPVDEDISHSVRKYVRVGEEFLAVEEIVQVLETFDGFALSPAATMAVVELGLLFGAKSDEPNDSWLDHRHALRAYWDAGKPDVHTPSPGAAETWNDRARFTRFCSLILSRNPELDPSAIREASLVLRRGFRQGDTDALLVAYDTIMGWLPSANVVVPGQAVVYLLELALDLGYKTAVEPEFDIRPAIAFGRSQVPAAKGP